jgi:cytochrome c
MKSQIQLSIVFGALLLLMANPVSAADPEITPQKVVSLVEKSVQLIQEKGPEAAFPVLSDPEGEFVDGELYVFTYDMDGTIVQHLRPRLVGKNMMNIKDKEGKCLACDFVRIAKEEGRGWSQYWWPKPGSREVSVKVSYIMKVPNHELFVGAGVYDLTREDVEAALK